MRPTTPEFRFTQQAGPSSPPQTPSSVPTFPFDKKNRSDIVAPSRTSSPGGSKHGSATNLAAATQDENSEPTTCWNCFTQTTPLWRSDPEGHPLCNACGLFLRIHGIVRPLSLETDVIKKRNRGSGASLPLGGSGGAATRASRKMGADPSQSFTSTEDAAINPIGTGHHIPYVSSNQPEDVAARSSSEESDYDLDSLDELRPDSSMSSPAASVSGLIDSIPDSTRMETDEHSTLEEFTARDWVLDEHDEVRPSGNESAESGRTFSTGPLEEPATEVSSSMDTVQPLVNTQESTASIKPGESDDDYDEDGDEHERWIARMRAEKRGKRRAASPSTLGKRTLTMSIDSDTSNESDDDELQPMSSKFSKAGASARRLGRKTMGERTSLMFEDPPPSISEDYESPEDMDETVDSGLENLPFYGNVQDIDSEEEDGATEVLNLANGILASQESLSALMPWIVVGPPDRGRVEVLSSIRASPMPDVAPEAHEHENDEVLDTLLEDMRAEKGSSWRNPNIAQKRTLSQHVGCDIDDEELQTVTFEGLDGALTRLERKMDERINLDFDERPAEFGDFDEGDEGMQDAEKVVETKDDDENSLEERLAEVPHRAQERSIHDPMEAEASGLDMPDAQAPENATPLASNAQIYVGTRVDHHDQGHIRDEDRAEISAASPKDSSKNSKGRNSGGMMSYSHLSSVRREKPQESDSAEEPAWAHYTPGPKWNVQAEYPESFFDDHVGVKDSKNEVGGLEIHEASKPDAELKELADTTRKMETDKREEDSADLVESDSLGMVMKRSKLLLFNTLSKGRSSNRERQYLNLEETSKWDAYNFFDITRRYSRGMRCIGKNRQGRPCARRIPTEKYIQLRHLLNFLEIHSPQEAEGNLQRVASLSLCQGFHPSQAENFVKNWKKLLHGTFHSTAAQLHSVVVNQDTMKWDAYVFFGVTGRDSKGMNCIGNTRRGTRCAWDIPSDTYDQLRRLFDNISIQPLSEAEKYLRDIASLSLCQGWHWDQAYDFRMEWRAKLKGVPYAVVPFNYEDAILPRLKTLAMLLSNLEESLVKNRIERENPVASPAWPEHRDRMEKEHQVMKSASLNSAGHQLAVKQKSEVPTVPASSLQALLLALSPLFGIRAVLLYSTAAAVASPALYCLNNRNLWLIDCVLLELLIMVLIVRKKGEIKTYGLLTLAVSTLLGLATYSSGHIQLTDTLPWVPVFLWLFILNTVYILPLSSRLFTNLDYHSEHSRDLGRRFPRIREQTSISSGRSSSLPVSLAEDTKALPWIEAVISNPVTSQASNRRNRRGMGKKEEDEITRMTETGNDLTATRALWSALSVSDAELILRESGAQKLRPDTYEQIFPDQRDTWYQKLPYSQPKPETSMNSKDENLTKTYLKHDLEKGLSAKDIFTEHLLDTLLIHPVLRVEGNRALQYTRADLWHWLFLGPPSMKQTWQERLISAVEQSRLCRTRRLGRGIQRLQWTCSCGHKASDDFHEHGPGATVTLANELMEAGYISHAKISNSTNSPISSFIMYINNAFTGTRQRLSQIRSPSLPRFSTAGRTAGRPMTCLPANKCRWLHMCLKKRPYATKMEPLHVCKDEKQNSYTDASFFKALRKAYYSQRSWKEKLLFKLNKIEFVEFDLCPENLVDHIIPDKLPPTVDEYEFQPPPPLKKCPPIGASHMMHLFTSCSAQPLNTSLYLRHIPKRKDQALSFQPDAIEDQTGYGLHFVEKLNSSLAVTVMFVISLVVGIVFGIWWSIRRQDVQGAFGVASYVTSVIALAVVTWQMWSV